MLRLGQAVAFSAVIALVPVQSLTGAPVSSASGQAKTPAKADSWQKGQEPARLIIDTRKRKSPVTPMLMGANHRFAFNGYGVWDPAAVQPVPKVLSEVRATGISLARYPGGQIANMFHWHDAIGPVAGRDCQVNGRWTNGKADFPLVATYGVEEHFEFARQAGLKTQVTIPFVANTPRNAAAFVEYLNASVGTNPGGGRAWAELRRRNQMRMGLPVRPYLVKWFTVGNEPYMARQRFWMSDDYDTAMRQYIGGGSRRYPSQMLGRNCRRNQSTSSSNGAKNQRMDVLYPPIKPGSARLHVTDPVAGRQLWRQVDNLNNYGPKARVYELDNNTGVLHFGDRVHGKVPPKGADVRITYVSTHDGFVELARAMKRIDPSIDVCSEWSSTGFIDVMVRRGNRFDCLAHHPYNFMTGKWRTPRKGYDAHMVGERPAFQGLVERRRYLRERTNGRSYVAINEYGALSVRDHQKNFPYWQASMTNALYMASQLARMVRIGQPWAEGGELTAGGRLNAYIGPAPGYVMAGKARMMQLMRTMLHGRGKVVGYRLRDNPVQTAGETGSYRALVSLVTRDASGAVNVLLINRDPNDSVTVQVSNRYYPARKTAQVWRLASDSFASYNTIRRPSAVRLSTFTREVQADRFVVKLPKHSIYRIRLRHR